MQFLTERWKAGDGYIMGATGQRPGDLPVGSWWFRQYRGRNRTKALYWRARADRVWDCNGLAEGYYKDQTGVSINTRARNNYASWCDPKGKGVIPAAKRVPGAAVFKANRLGIHHVGYLVAPVVPSNPAGDWYIIEAKGVMYGVIRSRLSDGGWNRWGWMTKYVDYAGAQAPAAPTKGQILANDVNIRTGPGVGYSVLSVVGKGDTLDLSGESSGNWTGVVYKGAKAWVYGRYIKAVAKG